MEINTELLEEQTELICSSCRKTFFVETQSIIRISTRVMRTGCCQATPFKVVRPISVETVVSETLDDFMIIANMDLFNLSLSHSHDFEE